MFKMSSKSALAAGTMMLVLTGCGGDSNGKVSVKLTDAPGDQFEKAVVTLTRVYLKGSGDADVELLSAPYTTDLLTLANDAADIVKDAEVPTGSYKELRFVISGGYIQVKEEGGSRIYATSETYEGLPAGAQVEGDLQMPSAASSGLKVKFDKDAEVVVTSDGAQKVVLVDFDVAQSFGHAAGNSDRWVMGPVIKGADLAFSGNVKTTLALGAGVPLAGGLGLDAFSAVLVNAEGSREPLPFQLGTDGLYTADFKYLLPGSYQVDVVAASEVAFTTDPGHPAPATVGSGAESSVAFTLTTLGD